MQRTFNVCVVHAYPSRDLLDMLAGAGCRALLVAPAGCERFDHPALLDQRGVDLMDVAGVVSTCEALHATHGIDAVLALNESTVIQSAHVAHALGLSGNSIEAATCARSKYLAYHCYRRAGVDTPKTIALEAPWNDFERARRELGLPFVVKLADSMNSQGVLKIEDEAGYLDAIYALRSLLCEDPLDSRKENRNRVAYGTSNVSVIAQEYCQGDEFNIDVLYKDGEFAPLLVFQKAKMGANFGEKASFHPPLVPTSMRSLLADAACRAVAALGASVGCAHVEIKYVPNRGPVVIEAGLRPGGGFTVQAALRLCGISVYGELVAILSGGALRSPRLPEPEGAVLYGGVLFDESGKLVRLEGVDALQSMPHVSRHVVLAKPGDRVRALPRSAQPHAVYYVLEGPDVRDLLAIHDDLQGTIRPVVAEESEAAEQAAELEAALRAVEREIVEEYAEPDRHPAFREIDPELGARALPVQGRPLPELVAELTQELYQGYSNFLSPRFFAHYAPRPSPPSIVGSLVAHAYNQAPGAWRGGPASVRLEIEALHWLRRLVGYPSSCTDREPCGVFTSGGTMANATAIKLARDRRLGLDVRQLGLAGDGRRCVVYVSDNTHFSVERAVDFMGLGQQSLYEIPLTPQRQMDAHALSRAVEAHIAAGLIPLCIVATTGTTSCSDYDDITSLAEVARRFDVWLHVDAAATAPYAALPELAPVFAGLAAADSVTADPYKTMFLSFGLGCLLVKEPGALRASFDTDPDYFHDDRRLNSFKLSFRGTAPWASLALWLTFKTYGVEQLKAYFRISIESVRYLAARLRMLGDVEIYREPVFPVLCFRVMISSRAEINDAHNRALVDRICQRGNFYVTGSSTPRGEYIRICVDNHLVDKPVLDALAREVFSVSGSLLDSTRSTRIGSASQPVSTRLELQGEEFSSK